MTPHPAAPAGPAAPAAPAGPAGGSAPALEVRDVSLRFGAVVALSGVSFTVATGELFAIIGPNGAGKTSLFNLLSRVSQPAGGTIRAFGTDLAALRAHDLAAAGIARTFQNLALFPALSVAANVLVGRTHLMRCGPVRAGLRLPAARREERAHREAAMEALALTGLAHLADHPAGALPYGVRKKVELARAIAMEPRLVLLDEPVAGLSQAERAEMADLIRAVRARNAPTVVLVEHDMTFVMALASRVLVLDFGKVIACGGPEQIQASPEVISAYLGEPAGGGGAEGELPVPPSRVAGGREVGGSGETGARESDGGEF